MSITVFDESVYEFCLARDVDLKSQVYILSNGIICAYITYFSDYSREFVRKEGDGRERRKAHESEKRLR
jgi:hypothetical protein